MSICTSEEDERSRKGVAWLKARRALRGGIPTLLRWWHGPAGVLR